MITDEQIQDAYLQQYERGILKKEVRSYEVSVWTLQDEFLTMLKWSDAEHKGRIQYPKMTLSVDGTQELSFSIPMYYDNGFGTLIENPNWYNTQNGNLLIDLRKIKVIFNKRTDDEAVFDFVITKINEVHDGDILTCEVTCEGLAFHELGKIGYKYNLSLEEFDYDYAAWQKSDKTDPAPKANVQYWCSKIGLTKYPILPMEIINPGRWYYEIKMDWSTMPYATQRLSDIVYEESYVRSWDSFLYPKKIEPMKEKERIVDMHESNIYNITQEIAKQFGIYCRYEYKYDNNYHIIERKVIFFNNYLHDRDTLSLTYPHSSKSISREMDGTDIVTKMYVLPMSDETTLAGEANICECSANKTLEDYILNFDYLKDTRGITDEQVEEIKEYEKDMAEVNNILIPLSNQIAMYERQKTEIEAKITYYKNSVSLDTEQIRQNNALALELIAKYNNSNTPGQYIDAYNENNPTSAMIIEDKDGLYYINLKNQKKGLVLNTLHLYREYSTSTHELSGEITNYSIEYDEYGVATGIYGISPTQDSSRVYLTYEYNPMLYYDTIIQTWSEKLYQDTAALEEYENKLENLDEYGEPVEPYGVQTLLDNAYETQQNWLEYKQNKMKRFEEIMRPALREGYWQPENYQDYSEKYSFSKNLSNQTIMAEHATIDNLEYFITWDTNIFDTEQDLYYENGVKQEHIVYPCINISSIYSKIQELYTHYDNLYIMFNNNYVDPPQDVTEAFSNIKNIRSFAIGSEAVFSFIRSHGQVFPALILTGAKSMTQKELSWMRSANSYISLGTLVKNITGKTVYINVNPDLTSLSDNSFWLFNGESCWMVDPEQDPQEETTYIINNTFSNTCQVVFPRIRIYSLQFKTSSDTLFINYDNELLESYRDYYITNDIMSDGRSAYIITIKPEVMARHALYTGLLEVDCALSNASTAIYLDALEISKENAYPRVSYTITPNLLNPYISSTLYGKLNWLVMINDTQLKFDHVFGYISKLDLDLDAPWNDAIEVKNYKNKFEDLFSTIIAQTEAMQRNEQALSQLASGTYSLTNLGFQNTLRGNDQAMINYLAENFLTSPEMNEYLSNIFFEVGSILSDSNHAIGETQALTLENSAILSGFSQVAQDELIPHVYRQTLQPDEFNKGDIWIEVQWDNVNRQEVEVGRYVATSSSKNAIPGYGWTKTYGGTMAQIEGPGINMDADRGILDLFGDNINIYGNYAVNIGGVEVNIGSVSNNSNNYGGINLVATGYNNENFDGVQYSRIKIHPTEIEMAGSQINMLSGTGSGVTSAFQLKGNGIWIGSTASVKLFSGNISNDGSGSNIELNPNYLLLGVSRDNASTAVKITPDSFVVASGSVSATRISDGTDDLNGIGASAGIQGMKITKDFLGMAVVGTLNGNNVLNAFILNRNGLTLGCGVTRSYNSTMSLGDADLSNVAGGSYIRLSGNEILLHGGAGITLTSGADITMQAGSSISLTSGNTSVIIAGTGITLSSSATLSVSTENVVIDSTATGNNTLFRLGSESDYALLYTPNGGLQVKGNITANGGEIGGWTITPTGLIKTGITLGSTSYAINAGNGQFTVDYSGNVTLKALWVDGQAIDFTTAFNQAVSLWGQWSSQSTFTAFARFYNNNALTASEALSASFSITSVEPGVLVGSTGNVMSCKVNINLVVGGSQYPKTVFDINTFDTTKAADKGWELAAAKCTTPDTAPADTTSITVADSTRGSTRSISLSSVIAAAKAEGSGSVTHSPYLTTSYSGSYVTVTPWCSGVQGSSQSFAVGGCFIEGTPIQLFDGSYIPIEKLMLGMQVLSYNEINKEYTMAEVAAIRAIPNIGNIVTVYLSSGKTITMTKSHPILTTQGWKALDISNAEREHRLTGIQLLEIGDEVVNITDEKIYITDIIERKDLDGSTVYNCDVNPNDTYIVEDIVVHNANDGDK